MEDLEILWKIFLVGCAYRDPEVQCLIISGGLEDCFESPEEIARDRGKAWVEKNWGNGTDWSPHRVSSTNNA